MKRFVFLVLLAACVVLPASAQELAFPDQSPSSHSASTGEQAEPIPVHVTDQLMQRPSAQKALRQFQRDKRAGRLPINKSSRPDFEVGDTRTFQVLNIGESTYDPVTFEVQRVEERYYLWVASDQLSNVREQDIDALNTALAEMTPEGSINAEEGIIRNDETIFGNPPNVDDDGRSDILLTDIKDGYDPNENPSFVAGFVDGNDLSNNGYGNHRDILYLDAFPGLYTGSGDDIDYRGPLSVSSTAAHEYQHLIHFNYDRNESTFVNEGLSEFAEVANGYPPRPPGYLSQPNGYNVSLARWQNELTDYQRAGLFTTYISEQIGVMETGRITQDNSGREGDAVASYRSVLESNGLTLRDVLYDFHTTNFLNEGDFAYEREGYQGVRATPTRTVDGRTIAATEETSVTVQRGAVQYLAWNNVENFRLELGPATNGQASNLRVRAILFREQTQEVRTLDGLGSYQFEGEYDRVAFAVTHLAPVGGRSTRVTYSAEWDAGQTFTTQSTQYDDGNVRLYELDGSNTALYIPLGSSEVLTRFENPAPDVGFLASVQIPLAFTNQFAGSEVPADAPNDFTLVIRGSSNGGPSRDLFTLTREVPTVAPLSATLNFVEVDLSEFAGQLGDLPEEIFIGYRNAGGDDNTITFPTATYEEENVSFLGVSGRGWRRFWDTELTDGSGQTVATLDNAVLPVRATFLIPNVPPSVELAQNTFRAVMGGSNAEVEDGVVTLTWETAQETNLSRFDVLRSTDGEQSFQEIGTVRANNAPSSYQFSDSLFALDDVAGEVVYRLRYVSPQETSEDSGELARLTIEQLAVSGNRPNPFSAGTGTKISYTLPADGGQQQRVRLDVYDALGRRVATLVDEEQPPGLKTVHLGANHMSGLSAGVYFFVLSAGSERHTGRMVFAQ